MCGKGQMVGTWPILAERLQPRATVLGRWDGSGVGVGLLPGRGAHACMHAGPAHLRAHSHACRSQHGNHVVHVAG